MTRVEQAADGVVRQIRNRIRRRETGLFGIGFEILPWELVGVVVAEDGTRLGGSRVGLPSMAIDPVVSKISELAADLAASTLGFDLSDSRLGLGVALGAPIDPVTGVVHYYANGPHDHASRIPPYVWKDEDLAGRLEQTTGCATFIENDAHALAAFEQKLGVGLTTSSFAVLLIRHGIGGGIVIDNQLLSIPAEVGHVTMWPHGLLCDCGLGAHLEAHAGRRAIPALVAEKTGLSNRASFEWAVNLANSNDPMAERAVEAFAEAGTAIARGIAAILTLFGSPHLIIHAPEELVADNAGAAGEAFMNSVYSFSRYTFQHLGKCKITKRSLTLDRGAIGAALIALHRHFSMSLDHSLEVVR